MPGMFDHKKNDQVIRETEHNLHGQTNQICVYVKNKGHCIFGTTRLINQELRDESTDESAGYLPRLATVKVLFVSGKSLNDQPL